MPRLLIATQGETESRFLAYAERSNGAVQAQVAESGFINAPGKVIPKVPGLPIIELEFISAALLDQSVEEIEKDALFSDDMTRISQKVLGQTAQAWRSRLNFTPSFS